MGAGLPETSVADFITALTSHNETALALVPGASSHIVGAGARALKDTYATAFRNVWLSAVGFVGLAAIGTFFVFFLVSLPSPLVTHTHKHLGFCNIP